MDKNRFRSWNINKNKFYYFCNGRYYDSSDLSTCISERICTEFDWSNAEQFSGVIDNKKNKDFPSGQQVYDNDIVKIKLGFHDDDFDIHYSDDYFIEKIIVDPFIGFNGMFKKEIPPTQPCSIEVIGNIHENPELEILIGDTFLSEKK